MTNEEEKAWKELAYTSEFNVQTVSRLLAALNKIPSDQLKDIITEGPAKMLEIASHFENPGKDKDNRASAEEWRHGAYKENSELIQLAAMGVLSDKPAYVLKAMEKGPKAILEVDRYFSGKKVPTRDEYVERIADVTGLRYEVVKPYLSGMTKEQKQKAVVYAMDSGSKFNLEEFKIACSTFKEKKS